MKIAFAVSNLGASQFNHDLILAANRAVDSRVDLDITLFFENISRPCLPLNVASMHIVEGWGYDGPVVATNFSTAEKMLRFPTVSKRMLYSYDLDWMRINPRDFRVMHGVYSNPNLILAARCTEHAEIIAKVWNRHVKVIRFCDINAILESFR
jgi:hypothetical protein